MLPRDMSSPGHIENSYSWHRQIRPGLQRVHVVPTKHSAGMAMAPSRYHILIGSLTPQASSRRAFLDHSSRLPGLRTG